MSEFTNGLITQFVNEVTGERHIAAKLQFGESDVLWVNGGEIDTHGRIKVVDGDYNIAFSFDQKGLAKYLERVQAGNDKAHRTVIGRGSVNGVDVVGFPAKGNRIGLKPAIETSYKPIGFEQLGG